MMQLGGELLIKKCCLHFTLPTVNAYNPYVCVWEASQINVVWCNKSQHEHPDVSANIFVRKKTPFFMKFHFSQCTCRHISKKKVSLCVKRSDLKHIYCYNAIYYGWQYSGSIYGSAEFDHEVKIFTHSSTAHTGSITIYFSYFSTYNFFQIMTNTRINLSIKIVLFLFRSSHKFMMTKRFFFIAVSNPLLPFLFFWWEQAYHFDLCSELLFSYAFVLLKGSKDDGWAKKNWDLNNF